ncbi:MAG: pitrilysin family protein [Chloroflexota bacterium]
MYQKTVLDSGLRVITVPMPQTRSVSISIFIGAGSRYENDKESGISHFIEHLLFRGTQRRPTSQHIAEAIEGVGGILNAATDREITYYWAKVTREHFDLALDVLTDMVLHARFEPADIEKERQVIIEEINMSLDSPSQRVDMLIDELLWAGHPLGRDVAGTKETVSAITRDDMLHYLAHNYLPDNTVVAVAGGLSHDEAIDRVRKYMDGWVEVRKQPGYLGYEAKAAKRLRIETRDIEEAHLCLALPGLSLFDPRRYTLDLLNTILGAGMSSRLFREVRDRLGLVYNIGSFAEHLLDSGSLVISAGVEPKNLKAVIEATMEQLACLKEKTPDFDLAKAKEIVKGHLILRLEDSRASAAWVGAQEVRMGQVLTVDQVVERIDAVTTEDIQVLAKEMLVGDRLRLAIVGPVAQDEPLEGLLKI